MSSGFDPMEVPSDLPPELHLKMALDFLYVRAKKLNMPMTSAMIEAACLSAIQELGQSPDPVHDTKSPSAPKT